MLGSSNFWFGVVVGIALLWAYRKFGGVSKLGGSGKQQGQ